MRMIRLEVITSPIIELSILNNEVIDLAPEVEVEEPTNEYELQLLDLPIIELSTQDNPIIDIELIQKDLIPKNYGLITYNGATITVS